MDAGSLSASSKYSSPYVNVTLSEGRTKVANRSFEDVAKFKYLRTTLTDQNSMHEEIKNRKIRECLLPIGPESLFLPACCLGM
jgi:hypothetical protein